MYLYFVFVSYCALMTKITFNPILYQFMTKSNVPKVAQTSPVNEQTPGHMQHLKVVVKMLTFNLQILDLSLAAT